MSLRPALPADSDFLMELSAERQAVEFASAGLPSGQLQQLLALQCRAQEAAYATNHPAAFHGIVIDSSGIPVGRLIVDRAPDHLRLVDVVLAPTARGLGTGTALLAALLHEGARLCLPVRLSVVWGNPAQQLYERLGFRVTESGAVRLQMEWNP